MGSKSDYLENKVLDHLLGAVTFTPPTTVYVALYTVVPTDAGGGTEVTGDGYARVAVTNNATNFPAAATGSKSNGTPITFPQASAAWGTVAGWAILDAATAGNFLFWGDVSPTKTVNAGDTPQFAVGALTFVED